MTDKELMQQALEALDWLRHHLTKHHGCLHMDGTASGIPAWLDKTETALRDRLAQPEQEPVWIQPNHLQKARQAPFLCRVEPEQRDDFVPLYTAPQPRQWQGLTDEEKAELDAEYGDDTLAHLDAIEAKLREKNT